ncbi:hypothetical protein [Halalkalibaculum sp. DA384]|uniref:hypothetical protein n=1 Tax=Halalkalibaculum sp. DA384 TaxID=3373606 RepID=UPI003754E1B7
MSFKTELYRSQRAEFHILDEQSGAQVMPWGCAQPDLKSEEFAGRDLSGMEGLWKAASRFRRLPACVTAVE